MLLFGADRHPRSYQRDVGFSVGWGDDEEGSAGGGKAGAGGSGCRSARDERSLVLATAEAVARCTGGILSVHEADRRQSRLLHLLRLSPDSAQAILSFDPESDPAALVHDSADCRVVLTRLNLQPIRGFEPATAELLAGGSVFQMVLDRESERMWLLTLVRDQDLPAFSEGEVAMLSSLAPALRAVLRQEQEARQLAATADMVYGSLDHLAFGILIVDADRRVLWSNAAARAILTSGGVVELAGRRFKAREPRRDLRLREIIHELAEAPPGTSRALAVGRDDGPPIQLGFARLPGAPLGEAGTVTAVFISGDTAADLSARLLRDLYELTPVEAEIARLICQGLAPADAADHLRLSVHTVRDYLKPIFQKMGVRRQADMVRVTASFAGLLQWRPGGRAPSGPQPCPRPRKGN